MTLPDWLAALLPRETADAWPIVASLMPEGAALYGGTGLAVHLEHRLSRDLDVFCADEFDPDDIEAELSARGDFAATLKTDGTLNGMFNRTKVQFLHAANQAVLDTPDEVADMRIASMSDLIATKLHAILGRGELRDYFDLKCVEDDGRTMEEGIGLYLARYPVSDPESTAMTIARALGSLDDVSDDPSLPETYHEISTYWRSRQPQVVASLDQYGAAPAGADIANLSQAIDMLRAKARSRGRLP